MSARAMDMLRDLDKPVYDALVSGNYVFWDEPAGGGFFGRYCAIAPAWSAWKEHGIIACMIQSYMGNTLVRLDRSVIRRGGKEWQATMYKRAYSGTRAWLEQHGFPQELADCYL